MSSSITLSSHHAMNTWWQIRISGENPAYCAQASQAAFLVTDRIESLMSRFRDDSEISALAKLPPGGRQPLSSSVFDCLALAAKFHEMTHGSFDVCASKHDVSCDLPRWHLDYSTREFVAEVAPCKLDLGAIAKGFALDRMAEELALWGISKFLLMSSGSSILAGDPPEGEKGWAVTLGEGEHARMISFSRLALGTSGFALQPGHIIDPKTGLPSNRYLRTWALATSAAQADALSTAWMNMDSDQIEAFCADSGKVAACLLFESGKEMHMSGLSKFLEEKIP